MQLPGRIGTIAIVTLLVAVGAFAWIGYVVKTQASLWDRTQAKVDTLSATYVRLIGSHEQALGQLFTADDRQKAAFAKLSAIKDEISSKQNQSIIVKLQDITRMQVAALTMFETANAAQQQNPEVTAFQREIGSKSELSGMLEDYNGLAREWNLRSISFGGSLAAEVTKGPKDVLPYLRSDGKQDDALLIQI
jgi:hypothetical protein